MRFLSNYITVRLVGARPSAPLVFHGRVCRRRVRELPTGGLTIRHDYRTVLE